MMSRRFSPTLERARDVDRRMADELDSPPLTEGSQIDPRDALEMDSTPPPPSSESPKPADSDLVSMNEPLSSNIGAGALEGRGKRRMSERTRKQETGYDALEGRNDGEADLDLSAPQAEGGGSGAYLAGKAEYRFPQHRLRTKMHGGLSLSYL